jgi:hypothetical protein
MEIIKTLKAEQKVLEKKLHAIQKTLKAAFDAFHKAEAKAKRGSATKRRKKAPAKRTSHKIGLKKSTRKPTGHLPVRRAA